ncbi:MAG: hypothetical protein ACLQPV_01060 [Vulcanimicrobiaceae bacterium]
MAMQKPRAFDALTNSEDGRALLLRALHLLDAERRENGKPAASRPGNAKPGFFALTRILSTPEVRDENSVTLTKLQVGASYWYEVASGHVHVHQARADGKARVRGKLVATRTCDPARTSIIGFSLWRGKELVNASLDPELRDLLVWLGVPQP